MLATHIDHIEIRGEGKEEGGEQQMAETHSLKAVNLNTWSLVNVPFLGVNWKIKQMP